jgi:hypothetical protein
MHCDQTFSKPASDRRHKQIFQLKRLRGMVLIGLGMVPIIYAIFGLMTGSAVVDTKSERHALPRCAAVALFFCVLAICRALEGCKRLH